MSKRRGRVLLTLVILLGILGMEFSNRYYYLMPQIDSYIEALKEPPVTETPENPPDGQDNPNPESPSRPSIDLSKPNEDSLSNQFFATDETTGEAALRTDSSAGMRALLILHAGNCFLESHGLGVGLGNTEMLARDRAITGESRVWSIHCFIARVIGDYGLFALIPLILIGCNLLLVVFRWILRAIQRRDREMAGYGLLFLAVMLTYPFASTASSDAQDVLSMWIYLAILVLETDYLAQQLREPAPADPV